MSGFELEMEIFYFIYYIKVSAYFNGYIIIYFGSKLEPKIFYFI